MRRWTKAIGLVVLLAAGALLLFRRAHGPVTFTFSDGMVIEVAKITTGKIHRFRSDNRWQDYLGFFLPQSLRSNLHPHVIEYTTTNAEALVVWTIAHGVSKYGGFYPDLGVADQHGVVVHVGGTATLGHRVRSVRSTSSTGASNVLTEGWLIAPLPRHSRQVGIVFYNGQVRAAEVQARNPAYHPSDALRPENLPQVKPAGDVQIKLASVVPSTNPQIGRPVVWTVTAELTRNGEAPANWQFDELEVFDNIGSLALSVPVSWPLPKLEHRFGALWPDTAWRLRLWAVKRTGFTSNEVWVLEDVPADLGARSSVERRVVREMDGMRVELLGFRGVVSGPAYGQVNVDFSGPARSEGMRIRFLQGQDDQGRAVQNGRILSGNLPSISSASGAAEGKPEPVGYTLTFEVPPRARTLTLQFVVQRARFADFVVQPTTPKQLEEPLR